MSVFKPQKTREILRHYRDRDSGRLQKILEEFSQGFHFLRKYDLAASVFGSSRASRQSDSYQEAYQLAFTLSKAGFAIITGGGPGVMEAANKGAFDAGGQSAGLNIRLPQEQRTNSYVKDSVSFRYFFTRKVMLSLASEVYIFFPGGFGTLDEFFEMVMLIQTGKKRLIPVILVNREYWRPLLDWIAETVYQKNRAISEEDMAIYQLVDNAQEAFELIQRLVKRGRQKRSARRIFP